ncbi:YjfB family protein [Chitinimonas sp. BJYL2]|uniref:YjfB family protein n=1 Tax=Chitinimonas sp. BJYL2 TaxID=2976696 RepID=UPI0022B542AC|nr:YjfB family protein [Chitinimonas sp. BJYL2]
MDITSIANAASNATSAQAASTASLLMLRKALDIQASNAATLLQALPQPASNPPNLGNVIDVRA